jgi:lipopolysaccharide transport system permease protein
MNTTTSEGAGVLSAAADAAATSSRASSPAPPVSPQAHTYHLPDEPLATIQPSRARVSFNFRDLWTYRELLYILAWRDVKVRYKQTALGIVWVVVQPLLMTMIFTVVLGRLARVPSEGAPYPLFVYVGLAPWTFFSGAVSGGANSLVGNAQLITKVYFPRLIIPAASIAARLVDLLISLSLLFCLLLYYRVPPTWHLLMAPALILLMTLLAFAIGSLISALNVKYRDAGLILPVILQLWMFVSPVIYPSALVPERWRGLYALNPLVGIVENFRAAVLGQDFNWPALGVSALAAVASLVGSAYIFRRIESEFADLI